MHLQEILVVAAGPSSAAQGSGNITLYDITTGTSLLSLKQTSAAAHCTVATETKNGQGGLLLAAQIDKSLLHVYTYQKDQLHLRIVLPEKLTSLAIDEAGEYCAGGTQAGRIYLWEVASGILFNSFEAHYRRVTTLKFSQDGAALVSGSEDSSVNVWSVPRLLDDSVQNEIPTPYCTLSDHTLPVTDIVIGVGTFPHCRVLTASMDNSCKLWDLSTRSVLTTFLFPHPIVAAAMDSTERVFFASSPEGQIHQVNLFRKRIDKIGQRSGVMEAVGGDGLGSAERIGQEEAAEKHRLISAGHPVTSLTISITSSLLIAGTSNGYVQIIDIASHQIIRTISSHKDFSINDVKTMLKPRDLMGHATLGDPLSAKDTMPIRSITSFHRTRDPKMREAHEVLLIPPAHPSTFFGRVPTLTEEELIEDHRFFVNPSSAESAGAPASSARVAELEAELARVREQLTRAKGLNNALWETTVTAVLADKKLSKDGPAPMETDVADDSGRAKKRGRQG